MISSLPVDTQVGAVAFLDELGWKGIYQRMPNALELLRDLVQAARQNVGSEAHIVSISDTIVLFAADPESQPMQVVELLANTCRRLLPISLEVGLPLRGAIAWGDYQLSGASFIGPAIDEAAEWHEQLDWIGVHLTPSAEFVCHQSLAAPESRANWMRCKAPTKSHLESLNLECIGLNWFESNSASSDSSGETRLSANRLRELFVERAPILPQIASKFFNTLAFAEQCVRAT